jgi:hypothetical protein
MTKPIVRIKTGPGIDEFIDREMNDAEYVQYQLDQEVEATRKAEVETKAQAKAQLLAQLGITEEQAKLLLS